MDAIHGFIDAGGIAHGSQLSEEFEIFKNSEFENIESLFNVMNMMIARKFRNKELFFLKIPRTHRGRDPHCLLIKQ